MMADDEFEKLRESPVTWELEQEFHVAAEVYGPRRDIHAPAEELSDEELVDRFRTLLGVDLMFDEPQPDEPGPTDQGNPRPGR